jgi:outer membrane protein OmpA-like peptidoglycan-associated protein
VFPRKMRALLLGAVGLLLFCGLAVSAQQQQPQGADQQQTQDTKKKKKNAKAGTAPASTTPAANTTPPPPPPPANKPKPLFGGSLNLKSSRQSKDATTLGVNGWDSSPRECQRVGMPPCPAPNLATVKAAHNTTSVQRKMTGVAPNQPNLQLWQDPYAIEGLKNVLFDFDTHESVSEQAILEANAQWLKVHPNVRFNLAGYTDPRGDIVYNLALSQRRAEAVKQELIRMGVAENRIVFATGWGELYPNCLESTEECWKQDRRVVFVRASE